MDNNSTTQNPFGSDRPENHLRLIPEIDKWPWAIAFVQTIFGRTILTLAFIAVLASNYFARSEQLQTPLELLAIACLGILPMARLPKFGIALLIYYFARPHIFQGLSIQLDDLKISQSFFNSIRLSMSNHVAEYLTLSLALLLCSIWLTLKLLEKTRSRLPALWVFLIWLMILAVSLNVEPNSTLSLLCWLLTANYAACAMAITFYHSAQFRPGRESWLLWPIFCLQNLFMGHKYVFLRHPSLLVAEAKSLDHAVCQLKALKLIIWVRILVLFRDGIFALTFKQMLLSPTAWLPSTRLDWPNFNIIGLAAFNSLDLPALQVWATVYIHTLIFILSIASRTGYVVAIFRLAGIYLPRAVCRPYQARSFNEYFRRTTYYYSETIVHGFFYPLYQLLPIRKLSRSARIAFALFIALFLGGIAVHMLIAWQSFWIYGAREAIANIASWIPYFTLIATICCISATGKIAKQLHSAPQFIHFFINFNLHALSLLIHQYQMNQSWSDRLAFFRSLF